MINSWIIFVVAVAILIGFWFLTSIFVPGIDEIYTGPILPKTALHTLKQNVTVRTQKPSDDSRAAFSAKTAAIDSCLHEKDPWSPEIMKFIDPSKPRYSESCKPKTEITQLVESFGENAMVLSIRPEYENQYECRYRCVFPKDDYHYTEGNWTTFREPIQPPCDVFDVEGRKANDTDNSAYRELYYQVHRQPVNITEEAKGFGVQILLIDSTSYSSFIRAAPKFTHLLREEYDAIPFPQLNKVGLNSFPNAFAFLMGKQSEDMPASPINNETIKGDSGYHFDNHCYVPLDDEPSFIFRHFKERGYKTMLAEDWAIGSFNWPHCTGFNKPPADHYFRPFSLRADFWSMFSVWGKKHNNTDHYFTDYQGDHCKEFYQVLLGYLERFLKTYDDIQQKFSLTWMVDLNHHSLNAFYKADVALYNTFRRLKDNLENSFLFVMSDHGIRFGAHRNTDVGAIEDNNPALFIVLPKELRKNVRLKEIMRENARHLISQHDVYATLLAIAKNSHEWNGSDWEEQWPNPGQLEKLPNMYGSSLLHYPMKQPRDCLTLRIPFDYCQCPGKYVEVRDEELKKRLALKALEKLNKDIEERKYSDKCEKLQIDKSAVITLMELVDTNNAGGSTNSVRYFKITLEAMPGGGQFSIKMRTKNENPTDKIEFTADQFERLNKHGDQSKCASEDPIVMPLCYCKVKSPVS